MRQLPVWADRAACAGDLHPGWITHPRHHTAEDRVHVTAVCRDCPAIVDCDRWAAHEPDFVGWAAGKGWS